jgi:ATP-dependent Lon protease
MTGEITLRGQVMPVGGIKEKVLAAHRSGLQTIILPKRNEADLEDLPKDVRASIKFVFVDTVDEVLDAALSPATKNRPKRRKRKSKAKENISDEITVEMESEN